MKVIACIGEQLSDREHGKTEEVVQGQLKAIIGMYKVFTTYNETLYIYNYEVS